MFILFLVFMCSTGLNIHMPSILQSAGLRVNSEMPHERCNNRSLHQQTLAIALALMVADSLHSSLLDYFTQDPNVAGP